MASLCVDLTDAWTNIQLFTPLLHTKYSSNSFNFLHALGCTSQIGNNCKDIFKYYTLDQNILLGFSLNLFANRQHIYEISDKTVLKNPDNF